jgi:hypothetical protein
MLFLVQVLESTCVGTSYFEKIMDIQHGCCSSSSAHTPSSKAVSPIHFKRCSSPTWDEWQFTTTNPTPNSVWLGILIFHSSTSVNQRFLFLYPLKIRPFRR